MGSLFKTPTPPPPPPPPPPVTVRDEIGGVEQVPITQPDGTVTYVTRRIPLTDEQQAEQERYDSIMREALGEIERLSDTDYQADKNTQTVLDAWQEERERLLDNSFNDRSRAEERTLARRGLGDSTAAQTIRRQRQLDEQQADRQLQNERLGIEQNIRGEQLALQQNLYNTAAQRNDLQSTQALQSSTSNLSQAIGANQARQASLLNYYQRQYQPQPTLFSQILPVLGGGLAGPIGGVVGGTLGTLFR